MSSTIDYAKTSHMDSWLRHPVLGDPSFDTFSLLGETVHRSAPPYEWAVNGSLFRDKDGLWYCYAGLYDRGYQPTIAPRFRIYRSADRGESWEDLGWGFEEGFRFDGDPGDSDVCPDVVVFYDEKRQKYLLTYDTAAVVDGQVVNDGVALAWGDTPAGPFIRLHQRLVTCDRSDSGCGRFTRHYASTVIPRKNDYLALILTDSGRYYAWSLAASTAPAPEGPWTRPHVVLCCDRPEYYPCPLEFFPASVFGSTVYCPATSVAMNRNYQALFTAPVEKAHDPAAWQLTADGNLWHSRNRPDEHYGIWGQTYHGFLDPDTANYVVMFPARDEQGCGTISLAQRPWDTPHSDGFTMTAHGGPSISPLLAAYGNLSLELACSCSGTVDIAFAYNGILGPNDSISDSVPAREALSDYAALRIRGRECACVYVDAGGNARVLARRTLDAPPSRFQLIWRGGALTASADGKPLCTDLPVAEAAGRTAPVALILQEFSRIECSKFALTGSPESYSLTYNGADALLGAGQWLPDHEPADPSDELAGDIWHRIPGGYAGQGLVSAKWNVIGDRFTLPLQRSASYGTAGIWVDGCFYGSVKLTGEGRTRFDIGPISMGRHAIRVAPLEGRIAVSTLIVRGTPRE